MSGKNYIKEMSAQLQALSREYFTTRAIVETGMMLALAVLLGRIKVYTAASGGSVTAGSMIPLLLIAMLRGPVVGISAGMMYGIIDYMFGGWFVSPIQFLLDYPLAFGALGVAGFIWKPVLAGRAQKLLMSVLSFSAVFVGIGLRFLSHFLAGIWFWGYFAPEGTPVWIYSLGYQASYLVPEIIISAVFLISLAPALTSYFKRHSYI